MQKKKKKSQSGVKILVIGIILLCLVLGYYYYLSNKKEPVSEETPEKITEVQEVLLYNLDRSYPPTPKEVVKMFGRITQCFYNEEYSEEEFLALAKQIERLYDDELIANKTENQYIEDLRWDINMMKEQELVISSYTPSASTDVEFFSKDGYDCARLYCSFTMRKGTQLGASNQVFVLRKDAEGHWKIFGWQVVEEENEES